MLYSLRSYHILLLLTYLLVAPTLAELLDLRVTRGLGRKGYKKNRVSVITHGPKNFTDFKFDYSKKFQYRWTKWSDANRHKNQPYIPERWLHSTLIDVDGEKNITIDGTKITIKVPKFKSQARGVIFSDPCFAPPKGVQSWITCTFSKQWNTFNNTLNILQYSLSGIHGNNLDYWMMLGDNFYDQNGAITDVFYSKLPLSVKSLPMAMIIGNHDMWISGGPANSDEFDQHGIGMMQYYAMDPVSSQSKEVIAKGDFLDFSLNPDVVGPPWNVSLNTASNLIWYNAIGDVAFIGVSGAFTEREAGPHLNEACQWLNTMSGHDSKPNWLFLLGHWDRDTSTPSEQCDPCLHMDTPSIYHRMRNITGCKEYGNRFKYQDGHTHCNYIREVVPSSTYGDLSIANSEPLGVTIGGAGMSGCSQYGFEYIDSDNESLRLWYFELENATGPSRSTEILQCIKENGLPNCTQYGKLWFEGNSSNY
jgi:hypothetical protein